MRVKTTIGQYYPVESPIHNLDPRVKLISVLAFIIVLFLANTFFSYAFIASFLYFIIKISRVPIKFLIRGIQSLKYIIIFTMLVNIIFGLGDRIIFSIGIFNIYFEAIELAIKITIRFILLIISSSMLTLTTSPIALTGAIESLLSPFKKINMPVHEISMMMTIALRFIPTLMEETDKITKAQMSRGADFEQGRITQRVKSLIPILVPLFVSAFRRADELAMAMDARCYRGDVNRTKLKELSYEKKDIFAFIIMFIFVAIVFFMSFFI